MRRIADHFHIERQLTWDLPALPARAARLRRYARERLGTRSNATTEDETLALDDAQVLIARSEGFETWSQLVKHVERQAAGGGAAEPNGPSHRSH